MIPYGRQNISKDDVDAVIEVLNSDFLTQGRTVPAFEECIKSYCNSQYAIAVNSATSALHLACLALGVKKGDIVWTSPISFVASANCALYCQGTVDFVDINPRTYNICTKALEEKLIDAANKGNLPKVIIPVHLTGQSCEMNEIYRLSKIYNFKIIEDASHCIGGEYQKKKIGGCQYSDICVFSFHPVKIITTGEGGMITTNNKEIAKKINLLRSHGITKNRDEMIKNYDGLWYYEQVDLGMNYRMTDIQAALGISQMNRLDDFIIKRHKIFNAYNNSFKNDNVIKPWQHPDTYSSLHLYVIRVKNHEKVFQALRDNNIGVNLHYIPIYKHPYYEQFGFNSSDFPEAENYYNQAISIPIYPDLSESDQLHVVETIRNQVN